MSFEDVIRVAEAKIAPERFRRIEGEIGARDQPYVITEFLKPGIEELCQVLPPRLARAIVAYSEKRGWLGKVYFGMELKTTTVWGYSRFWALAKLKRLRRYGHRFAQEQEQIGNWLTLIGDAALLSPALALEVAECARLIKGYGDTHARGTGNFHIIETNIIRPALAGRMSPSRAVDAIASARTAALLDPEGEGLAKCIAAIGGQPDYRVAAE
jgi:indolepyruvate ferredoxin oxidoreductase beta subunit